MNSRVRGAGFTLIELLIVVSIVLVLAGVLTGALIMALSKGEESKARNFVDKAIPNAMEKWQDAMGKSSNTYPPSGRNLPGRYYDGTKILFEQLVTKPNKKDKPAYVDPDSFLEVDEGGKPVFQDPWGNPYIYRNWSGKKLKGGKSASSRAKKFNSTYDIISMGPDGEPDTDDDIVNGQP